MKSNEQAKLVVLVLLRDLWFEKIGDRADDIRPTHAQTFEWILDPTFSKVDAWNVMNWLCRRNSEFNSDRVIWVSSKAGSGKVDGHEIFVPQSPFEKPFETLGRWTTIDLCRGLHLRSREKL